MDLDPLELFRKLREQDAAVANRHTQPLNAFRLRKLEEAETKEAPKTLENTPHQDPYMRKPTISTLHAELKNQIF
ncbi:uncharacterized protein PAC_00223 [Phialocephala subalpina]|uniref:Uncharacterized protein n=1 Tax=Phialocephala subalpina TaxID=576137 RepID=A0A1L7WC53_9HELO|nr:uncharacterized protein PAC_00223 [Phialocephala subalpina]